MSAAALIPIGLATGLLSGLFGVGGGFLLVPLLTLLAWPLHDAIGTSLLYVTALGAGGTLSHAREANLDGRLVAAMAIPAAVGAQLGAIGAVALPPPLLDGVFALSAVAAAVQMGRAAEPAPGAAAPPAWAAPALGAVVGVLSGLLGVGGGLLLVPGQVAFLNTGMKRAVGNSLAVVVLTGASGVIGHARLGNVVWGATPWLLAGGAVGMAGGLALLARLHAAHLRRAFIGILVVVAAWMGGHGLYDAASHAGRQPGSWSKPRNAAKWAGIGASWG